MDVFCFSYQSRWGQKCRAEHKIRAKHCSILRKSPHPFTPGQECCSQRSVGATRQVWGGREQFREWDDEGELGSPRSPRFPATLPSWWGSTVFPSSSGPQLWRDTQCGKSQGQAVAASPSPASAGRPSAPRFPSFQGLQPRTRVMEGHKSPALTPKWKTGR